MAQNHGLVISGSGAPPSAANMTCDTFYESVIAAIELLNAGTHDDSRLVTTELNWLGA